MNKLTGSIAGAAGLIALLTLASRLVGFGRTVGESWVLGATPMADAYSSANNIPNILFEVAAGGALAGVVVPVLSSIMVASAKDKLAQVASAFLTWVLVVSIPVAVLVVIFADQIAHGIVGRTSPETVTMAATLLRIFAVQVPLYGLSVPLTGILQAHRKFVLPALAPLLSSLVVIAAFAGYWLTGGSQASSPGEVPQAALMWLAWGTTGGVIAFTAPQAVPVLKTLKLRPTLIFPDNLGRRVIALASAGFAGLVAQQAAILTIMLVANGAGGGAFPVFKYAQAMYFLPYAILAVPISTALYPKISERVAEQREGLALLISGSIRLVIVAGCAGGGLLFAVAPFVSDILSHIHDMDGLAMTMSILAGAVLGYSLLYHLTRVLFALGCGRGAMVMAVSGWSAVIIGALITAQVTTEATGRLNGLAISLIVGMTLSAVLGLATTRAVAGPQVLEGCIKTASVGVLVALASGFFGRSLGELVSSFIGHNLWAGLGAAGLASVVALGLSAVIVRWCDERTWKVYRWMT